MIKGNVHSFESFGTVDGPGIRFVVFLAGCPLKCKYCHNIDMALGKGTKHTPQEIVDRILKNKPYLDASGGGITISGGDPVYQPAFVSELLKLCKENDIHTAIDTSLAADKKVLDAFMPHTDLFMVSIKHFDDETHKHLTTKSNKQILENIKYLNNKGQNIRIRYLVLPGYTDTNDQIDQLTRFAKGLKLESLEILPYHKMGVKKWQAIGLPYELESIKTPSKDHIKQIKLQLRGEGLKVN